MHVTLPTAPHSSGRRSVPSARGNRAHAFSLEGGHYFLHNRHRGAIMAQIFSVCDAHLCSFRLADRLLCQTVPTARCLLDTRRMPLHNRPCREPQEKLLLRLSLATFDSASCV